MSINIVIIGAGEVGFNLAKTLSKEEYNITVIDIDDNKCRRVKNHIDARVIKGDGASQRVLQQIDMSEVDYLLALTRTDEVNLVTSKISSKMGAKKIICRLRNTEFVHKDAIVIPKEFGIDHVVFPEKAAQLEIENLIYESAAIDVHKYMNSQLSLNAYKITDKSPILDKKVKNIELENLSSDFKIVLILRDGKNFIPHSGSHIIDNDIIHVVCKSAETFNIEHVLGIEKPKLENIMILGSGKIGRLLSKSLENKFNIKIIEKDLSKAHALGESLDDSIILAGDGLDAEFLESENINETDCFISVTESEQVNILASLLAKSYNVKKVISHVSTSSYRKLLRMIGVDAVVSKNMAAVNEVVRIIRSNQESIPISTFENADIDVIEFSINKSSKFIKNSYKISDIPENISLLAIYRSNKIIIPKNDDLIQASDEILVLTKQEYIKETEELFI